MHKAAEMQAPQREQLFLKIWSASQMAVQRQLHSSAAATAERLLFETCPKSLEI